MTSGVLKDAARIKRKLATEGGSSFPPGAYAVDSGELHPDEMRRYPLKPRHEPGIDERRTLSLGIQMMCRPPHQHDPPLAFFHVDLVGPHCDLVADAPSTRATL